MPKADKAGRKMGVGVIGCGYWGPNLVRVFSALSGCGKVTVWDMDIERLEAAERDNPGVSRAGSLGELLADPGIGAVAVATPPASHYEIARKALLSGKHVFVEKPLTLSSAHARSLTATARAMKKVLMSGHIFLYSPAVRSVAALVGSGAIGRLRHMEFHRAGPRASAFSGPGSGVLWDLAPHDISIALRVAGKMPHSVSAESRPPSAGEEAGWGRLRLYFPGEVTAAITVSRFSASKIRLALVRGTSGRIIYDDTRLDFPVTLKTRSKVHAPELRKEEPLALECLEFLSAINGRAVPASSGDFGVRVIKIIETAFLSVSRGGVEVALL